MIIGDDKKKLATIILSKMRPDGSADSQDVKPEKQMDEKNEGLHAACEDILQAINDKSPGDLLVALKAFFDMADEQADEAEGE